MAVESRIVLGSGKIFVAELPQTGVFPADNDFETDANCIGYVSGGASLTYTPSFKTVKSDLGEVSKNFLTEEEVILKSGILTWNTETLNKLVQTGDLTTTGTSSVTARKLRIGGIANLDNKSYCIRFRHELGDNKYLRVSIQGNNTSGFEISFNRDTETVINAEFKATPYSETTGSGAEAVTREGILVEIREDV